MILHDISRELLNGPVYPGDPAPALTAVCRMEWGDVCNTSALSACVHNATHLDAPRHFVREGTDAASLPLELCVGECSVTAFEGVLLGAQAEELLPRLHKRVLFKGEMVVSPSAAFVLSEAGLKLIGVEGQSVSAPELLVTLALFFVVYVFLMVAWARVMGRFIKEGPVAKPAVAVAGAAADAASASAGSAALAGGEDASEPQADANAKADAKDGE